MRKRKKNFFIVTPFLDFRFRILDLQDVGVTWRSSNSLKKIMDLYVPHYTLQTLALPAQGTALVLQQDTKSNSSPPLLC
jgi:hypothetical protein